MHGNATATAGNIAAHELLFRLSIVSDLFVGVIAPKRHPHRAGTATSDRDRLHSGVPGRKGGSLAICSINEASKFFLLAPVLFTCLLRCQSGRVSGAARTLRLIGEACIACACIALASTQEAKGRRRWRIPKRLDPVPCRNLGC